MTLIGASQQSLQRCDASGCRKYGDQAANKALIQQSARGINIAKSFRPVDCTTKGNANHVSVRVICLFSRWITRWASVLLVSAIVVPAYAREDDSRAFEQQFERFKTSASQEELYHFLHAMPKGGDLHNHIAGSVHPEWYFQFALDAAKDGYEYYTKVRIDNCHAGQDEFGGTPYLLLYRTIPGDEFAALSECEKAEFKPLRALSVSERSAWEASLWLDLPHEGRDEFFQAHWSRLSGLLSNPYLAAETIVINMKAFSAEGLTYLETMVDVQGFKAPDGTAISPDEVMAIYRQRLAKADVKATGVTLRMQLSLVRFNPDALEQLKFQYIFAARYPEIVAINLVGREDNDKGYPLRFLQTLRELRQRHHGVRLSIHAGEVDEPNQHVRDTLLLGADRIGHGVNLITDPDTMLLMRHGPYLVEINLISNLLLEYIEDYNQHPFPEYLRTGIPVALSTDDRGMWNSTMTDEFYVAVREFDLSWEEIRQLSRNSLTYSFLEDDLKAQLLEQLNSRLASFESRFSARGLKAFVDNTPEPRGFICNRYGLCGEAATRQIQKH